MSSRKDIPVEIGEKTYLLRFNYDALCLIEDMTGVAFSQVLLSDTLKNRKLLLYAGLRKNHPDIQLESIGDLMDDADDLAKLTLSIVEAITNYFSKGKAAPAEAAKKKNKEAVPSTTKTDA